MKLFYVLSSIGLCFYFFFLKKANVILNGKSTDFNIAVKPVVLHLEVRNVFFGEDLTVFNLAVL